MHAAASASHHSEQPVSAACTTGFPMVRHPCFCSLAKSSRGRQPSCLTECRGFTECTLSHRSLRLAGLNVRETCDRFWHRSRLMATLEGNQQVHSRIAAVIGEAIPARAQTCFRTHDFEDASLKAFGGRRREGSTVDGNRRGLDVPPAFEIVCRRGMRAARAIPALLAFPPGRPHRMGYAVVDRMNAR